jgi:hypothetical protein
MRILVWGIEEELMTAETKAAYLVDTAYRCNADIEFIGIGEVFSGFRERLRILQAKLKTVNPEEVVVVMDGYDTLFNNKAEVALERFLAKNTRILISAEKLFTYQYSSHQEKYDQIESPYRYVNAGTYMGYAGDLLTMVNELFQIPNEAIDQGLIGMWLYDKLDQPEKAQLDTNCDIFWVTSGDWYEVRAIAETEGEIINPTTNTKIFIIHNTGNADPMLNQTYQAAYKNIMRLS